MVNLSETDNNQNLRKRRDTKNMESEKLLDSSPDHEKKKSSGTKFILLLLLIVLLLVAVLVIVIVILVDKKNDKNECPPPERLENRSMDSGDPMVEVSNGKLYGRLVKSPQGTDVEQYLGVPFAKPPLEDLRFANPEPYGQYPGGSYRADDYGATCLGLLDNTFGNFSGSDMWNAKTPLSEDCLFLNVWAPRPKRKKRAVVIWIFGGGFYSGSSALYVYDPRALVAHSDIIFVSMNYRLNTFGFLATGDKRIRGNFGMFDQQLAIKWVRENIEKFGGDPELITLWGESAGGASVGFHMMSEGSKHLFKRGIIASASPDSPWSVMSDKVATERSAKFFEAAGCPDDDNILQCLRQLPVDTIVNTEWVTSEFLVFPWVPVVDGTFITDTPHNLIKMQKFDEYDVMMGSNKNEGTFWILYSVPGLSKDTSSELTYQQYLKGFNLVNWDVTPEQMTQLKTLYTPVNTSDGAANRDAVQDVVGDRAFVCPSISFAEQLSASGVKNYYYRLTYRASNEPWPKWMGVIHGADIQWPMGIPFQRSRGYNSADVEFSKILMSYWGNFIKYGNPNGANLPKWNQNTAKSENFMEFQGPNSFIMHKNDNLREDYCSVVDKIYESLYT